VRPHYRFFAFRVARDLSDTLRRAFELHCSLKEMNSLDPSQLERCIASLNHLCESLPECDAKGKLRGKLGRLQSAVADYKRDGHVGPVCEELSAAHALVQRFHDAEPISLMLQALSALRQTIERQPAA